MVIFRKQRRYVIKPNDYRKKDISKNLINTIERYRSFLQKKEKNKHGKKAQKVTFIYASREIEKLIGGFK